MRRALPLALALALGVAGCKRERPYPPPERYLDADAAFSVAIPALGVAARQLGALYGTVSQAPPAAPLVEAYAAVKSQLGFDPLDPRGFKEAGIDPDGSAAAAVGGAAPLLVLPVVDMGRFDATAGRLARDRMGATERTSLRVKGLEVIVFRPAAAAEAALSYAAIGPHALLAPGPRGPDVLAEAAALPEERSLSRSPLFARARSAIGAGYLATVFAPPGSPKLSEVKAARDGAALGVRAGADNLGLRVALLLAPDRERFWKGLAAAGAPPESDRLDPDAALLLRWGGDPATGVRHALPLVAPGLARALDSAGVEFEKDLLPALAPGMAASLALAPTFTVNELNSLRIDPRRANLFRLFALEAVVPLSRPAAVPAFFSRLKKAGRRWGIAVAEREPSTWTVAVGKARLAFGLSRERLFVAGPPERLPALLARPAEAGYRAPTPAAGTALDQGMGGAVLDVGHLSRALESLPPSAYGGGPSALMVRALVSRYLDPASALASVSLRLDLVEGAALVDLEAVGRAPPPAKP